ncbi:MAG: DUF2231 domain-containing protein, partial [Blastocatellia bacterium]
MITAIRLVTVHPVFVHFTIGILPVMLFAYAMALWLKSERWTFAGDVATWVCAVITLVTMSFGLISSFYLWWPGGLEFWHYLHMGFGVGATIMLAALAITRFIVRQKGRLLSGIGTMAAAVFIAIFIGATGWMGGEILVYTSGMAVAAAGNGVLAPVGMDGNSKPANLAGAMGQTRALWASITTRVATMVAHHPTDQNFAFVASDARRMQNVAMWISANGAKTLWRANQPDKTASPPMSRGQMLSKMALMLNSD